MSCVKRVPRDCISVESVVTAVAIAHTRNSPLRPAGNMFVRTRGVLNWLFIESFDIPSSTGVIWAAISEYFT